MSRISARDQNVLAELVKAFSFNPDTPVDACIGATRIALDVLRALDVSPVQAVPVEYQAMNLKWLDVLDSDAAEERQRLVDAGAHCVVVGGPTDPGGKGWNGHLAVLVGRRLLVDLTAMQAARPEKGIVVERPVVTAVPRDWLRSGKPVVLVDEEHGTIVAYRSNPDNRGYLVAPDWTAHHVLRPIARDLEARIRVGLSRRRRPAPTAARARRPRASSQPSWSGSTSSAAPCPVARGRA